MGVGGAKAVVKITLMFVEMCVGMRRAVVVQIIVGVIVPGVAAMASTARLAAASVALSERPCRMKFPPPTPLSMPTDSSTRNSPSITGTRQ